METHNLLQFVVGERTRRGGPSAPDERSSPSAISQSDVQENRLLWKTNYSIWPLLDARAVNSSSVSGRPDCCQRIGGDPDPRLGAGCGVEIHQSVGDSKISQ